MSPNTCFSCGRHKDFFSLAEAEPIYLYGPICLMSSLWLLLLFSPFSSNKHSLAPLLSSNLHHHHPHPKAMWQSDTHFFLRQYSHMVHQHPRFGGLKSDYLDSCGRFHIWDNWAKCSLIILYTVQNKRGRKREWRRGQCLIDWLSFGSFITLLIPLVYAHSPSYS